MQLKKISDQWKIRMVKMPFTIVKYIIPIDLTLFSLLSIKFVSPYFHFLPFFDFNMKFLSLGSGDTKGEILSAFISIWALGSYGTSEKPATFGMIW